MRKVRIPVYLSVGEYRYYKKVYDPCVFLSKGVIGGLKPLLRRNHLIIPVDSRRVKLSTVSMCAATR